MTSPSVSCAGVIDIGTDTPNSDDVFLVDTNVWLLLTYAPAAGQGEPHQVPAYEDYINHARSAGSLLAHTGLTFTEMATVIERIEHKAFLKSGGQGKIKIFRRDRVWRRRVTRSVYAAWRQMLQFSEPIEVDTSSAAARSSLAEWPFRFLDATDALMLNSAVRGGVTQVLTDDIDFVSVPDITVLTSNPRAISAATQQSRLMVRP